MNTVLFPLRDLLRTAAAAFALVTLALPSASAQTPAGAEPVPATQSARPSLDVPYVPTPQALVERMLALAEVGPNDYVIDLGSGDGRIPVTAARLHGARAFGIDIDPERVAEANRNAEQAKVTDRVTFRQQNLFETDISEASVLTMYLLSSINMDLRPRILNNLRPGTRVVSHAFTLGDWEPDARETVEQRNVYFWVVPARVGGTWTMQDGGKPIQLSLTQQFQKVQGAALVDGRWRTLEDIRLRGPDLSFAIDLGEGRARRYAARVDGNAMRAREAQGTVTGWSAERAS